MCMSETLWLNLPEDAEGRLATSLHSNEITMQSYINQQLSDYN